jgi:hypothetical protein
MPMYKKKSHAIVFQKHTDKSRFPLHLNYIGERSHCGNCKERLNSYEI